MSDFDSIARRLDYDSVKQDTTLNIKPLSFDKVRDIKKLRQQIVITPCRFKQSTVLGVGLNQALIFFQYNYTVSQPFRISNYSQLQSQIEISIDSNAGFTYGCFVCLRYRTGNAVTRIYLGGGGAKSILNALGISAQALYRQFCFFVPFLNQLIPLQFVIEVWYSIIPQILGPPAGFIGIKKNCFLNTSITRNPTSPDDNGNDTIMPVSTVDYNGLSSAIPEVLPITPNPLGPWNSN